MSYFSEFPLVAYDFEDNGKKILLTNILRNVIIRPSVLESSELSIRYDYKDSDRPEVLAKNLYKDATLHWVVLHANDAVNPFYDFSLSDKSLLAFIGSKYPGETYFVGNVATVSSSSSSGSGTTFVYPDTGYTVGEYVFSETSSVVTGLVGTSTTTTITITGGSSTDDFYNGAVIEFTAGTGSGQKAVISDYDGDTLVATLDRTLTTAPVSGATTFVVRATGVVHDWNTTFSRLVVKDIFDTISDNDYIRGMTSDTQTIILKKVSDSKEAVHHFADSTGSYIDPLDTTEDYIAGYILGEVNSTITDAVVTNYQYEVNKNDSKRFISLIDPSAIQTVVSDFIRSMR